MRKNKLYVFLSILTIIFLFGTAATCTQCGANIDKAIGGLGDNVDEEPPGTEPGGKQPSGTEPGETPPDDEPFEYQESAAGSGFVWDTGGHIITNNHVIEGGEVIRVSFADGRSVLAELVGADADSDLAVLKIDLPADALAPITVSDSTKVKVGQIAIAIGNPFQLESSMTTGIISAGVANHVARSGLWLDFCASNAAIRSGVSFKRRRVIHLL